MYKSTFEMRSVANTYDCIACREAGLEHEVIYVDHGVTDDTCRYGAGIPRTMRRCTTCGVEDGPWVSSQYVEFDD